MDTELSDSERERAYVSFDSIFRVHTASLQALTLIASAPIESQLAVQLHLQRGMRAEVPFSDLTGAADSLVDFARAEKERGFETLRRSTLVASCGALEYLIKAVFVDLAAASPADAAAKLLKLKPKLSAAEVLGQSEAEQWMAVVDQAFESLAQNHPLMHERVVKLFTEYALLSLPEEQLACIGSMVSTDEVAFFNEAFLVRNCFVHNGGRVSAALARMTRQERGAIISLGDKHGAELLRPLKKVADCVRHLSLVL